MESLIGPRICQELSNRIGMVVILLEEDEPNLEVINKNMEIIEILSKLSETNAKNLKVKYEYSAMNDEVEESTA